VKLATHLELVQRLRIVELHLNSPYAFMAWCLLIKHRNKKKKLRTIRSFTTVLIILVLWEKIKNEKKRRLPKEKPPVRAVRVTSVYFFTGRQPENLLTNLTYLQTVDCYY
jgi:hypothetical protein